MLCIEVFCLIILLIYFPVPAYTTPEREALALFFGSEDDIPPLVNSTYGRETEILLQEGESLILTCSAAYPIKWTCPLRHKQTINHDSTSIHINAISIADNNTLIKCEKATHNATDNHLSTSIRINITPKESNESTEIVSAVNSSFSEFVVSSLNQYIELWIVLRRKQSFNETLLSRWWHTFRTPVIKENGGEVTKMIGREDSIFWPANFNASIQSENTLRPSLQLHPAQGMLGGPYVVNITDSRGHVYYSKTFTVTLAMKPWIVDLKVYPWNQTLTKFSDMVLQGSLNPTRQTENNKSYLIVCEFRGNPLLRENALITRNKFHCPPIPVQFASNNTNEAGYFLGPLVPGMLAADGSACGDFKPAKCGEIERLADRIGTNSILLSAKVTTVESTQFGCWYNGSDKEPLFLQKSFLLNGELPGMVFGVSATIIKPDPKEIIIGDNVTIQCNGAASRYHFVYVKVGNKYFTRGDFIEPGYELSGDEPSNTINLTIFNVTQNHSTSYACKAHSRFEIFMNEAETGVNMTVQEPHMPEFLPTTTTDTNIRIVRGSGTIDLRCGGVGAPEPKTYWFKDGVPFEYCASDKCHTNDTVVTEGNRMITISRSDTAYSGVYECQIKNKVGLKTRSFKIDIVESGLKPTDYLAIFGGILLLTIIFCIAFIKLYLPMKFRARFKAVAQQLNEQTDANKLLANIFLNDQANSVPYNRKYEVDRDRFTLSDVCLGSGEFGIVLKGEFRSEPDTTQPVAIKMAKGYANIQNVQSLVAELKIMTFMRPHVNIVQLLGACTSQLKDKHNLFVILEFCENGSLKDYLQENRFKFEGFAVNRQGQFVGAIGAVETLLNYAYQAAKGMEHLSQEKIIHRDMALRNLLLTANHTVKISDFGMSRKFPTIYKKKLSKDDSIPLFWMAPETLEFTGQYSEKSDVWSLGVVLWEIFSLGRRPYPDHKLDIHIRGWLNANENNRLRPPSIACDEIYQLMLECWKGNPDHRPHFSQCKRRIGEMLDNKSHVGYLSLLAHLTEGQRFLDSNVAPSNDVMNRQESSDSAVSLTESTAESADSDIGTDWRNTEKPIFLAFPDEIDPKSELQQRKETVPAISGSKSFPEVNGYIVCPCK